jgi:hypothetical protein
MAGPPFKPIERASYNAWWLVEHLLTEERMNGRFARARSRVQRHFDAELARNCSGRVIPVERRELDPVTFVRSYFERSRPVILAGLARRWPAIERWSHEWLAREYGGESVCITDYGDPDFVPLRDAIGRIARGESRFARFGTLLQNRPELVADLDLAALARLRPRLSRETSLQFFVAGAGSVSPLHADATCNFHVQIHGEKVWRIIEPRFNPAMRPLALGAPHFKSPLAPFDVGAPEAGDAPRFDVLEAVLEPGDVLFNPSFFWHEVRYRSPSISAGVRWVSPTSLLRGSPMMALLMAIAQNPSVFEALTGAMRGRVEGFYR